MKAQPTWETTYAHDRRAHRHRCRHCSKIINAGERVLMAKVIGNKTYAVHAHCADRPHGNGEGGWTVRDAMEAWGTDYLRACGYRLDRHPMTFARAS